MNKTLVSSIVALFMLVPLLAIVYYRLESARIDRDTLTNLANIVNVKKNTIQYWADERYGDGLIFSKSKNIQERVEKFLQEPNNPEHRDILQSRLQLMITAYNYEAALLVDTDDKVILSSDPKISLPGTTLKTLKQALASNKIEHTDFFKSDSGSTYIDWIAPIQPEEVSVRGPIAAVILRIDANHFIIPDLKSWPTPSKTAEILLMEHVGDDAIYINPPAQDGSLAMSRVPIRPGNFETVLTQEHGEESGAGRIQDYRGVEVLFAHSHVEGTPWHLIAKVDREEILAPVIQTLRWMIGITLFAVLIVTLVIARVFRQQALIKSLEIQAQKSLAAQQVEALGNNIPGGFIYRFQVSPSGTRSFPYISGGIEQMFGYKPEQVVSDSSLLLSLMDKESEQAYVAAESRSAIELSTFSQEIKFTWPTGRILWLQFNSEPHMESDGSIVWNGIGMDITERKLETIRVEKIKNLYRDLSRISESALLAANESQMLEQLCQIPVDSGMMKMVWIGIEEPASHRILVRHIAGEGADYLDDIEISSDAQLPQGRGITGTAWREQTIQINNDFEHNLAMAPWAAKALGHGWHSSACLPLFRGGRIYAVISLYNAWKNFFDDQVITILKTVVNDIGFALDALDARLAMQASEERTRLVLNSANYGIIGMDGEGNITFVNPSAVRLLGYAEEELIGRHGHALTHHHFPNGAPYPREDCFIYRTYTTGEAHHIADEVFWRKDGTSFDVEYDSHPIYQNGELMGAVMVFQDVTERLKLERESQRREEIFRAIVSQAPDAICLMDTQTLEFVEFNDAACNGLGYTREEFAQLRLPDIQGEFDETALRAMIANFIEAGSGHLETLRRTKDGRLLNVLVSVKVLQLQGRYYDSTIWTDITEAVTLRKQLEKERERLQNIIDGTHAGTWEWNLLTGEAVFNERWADMFGYQLDELQPFTTESWAQFVHPEDLLLANANLARHLAGETDYYQCDVRMRHRDGHWVWIADHGRVTKRDAQGKPIRVSGTHIDITDRKIAEQRLQDSEERFRKLFNESKQPLLLVEDGRFIDANQATLDMLGFDSLEEFKGTTPEQISPEYQPDGKRSSDKVVEVISAAYREGAYRFEWEHLRKDGSHFFAEVMLTPIDFGGSSLIHVVWTDITERKQNEAELDKLSLALEQSVNAVVITNLDAKIEYVNARFEEVTGYSRQEAIGMNPRVLGSGETPASTYRELWTTLLRGDSWQGEFINKRKDGSTFYESAHITPLKNRAGIITHYVATKEDITESKRISQELEKHRLHLEDLVKSRTAELLEANRLVKENEERYEYAVNATNDGLWDWNIKTGQVYYSPGYFTMLGYQPEDFPQHSAAEVWVALLHTEEREKVVANAQQALIRDGGYEIEFQMRCKDGSYKWILSRGRVVAWDTDGKPLRAVGTHVDLTLRKQMEFSLLELPITHKIQLDNVSLLLHASKHEYTKPN